MNLSSPAGARQFRIDPQPVFAPPDAPALLYAGTVMHARMKPKAHRFAYKVFNLAIDLDRLAEADGLSRLFSVNRRNAVSFHEADHMDGAHPSLRAYVDGLLAGAGLARPAARILLVCYPRVLDRVFNPIAVYYAYDEADGLVALVYEVRNTFGERHSYVCRVMPEEVSPAGIRQERDKLFYVSPFMGMAARYHFRMLPPGRSIRWRILESDGDGPLLAAAFAGEAVPLTTPFLAKRLLHILFQTWKIVGGIHFEALRLWLKGVRLVPRGKPPAPVSFADAGKIRSITIRDGDDRPGDEKRRDGHERRRHDMDHRQQA